MFQIKNDVFCLKISKIGAELEQFCINDINILWEKNELWNRQSPILFPFVGRVKDGYFIYNDQNYTSPIHGFIKDQPFDAVKIDSDYIELVTKYNENTLEMYPFKFEFHITYQLIKNKLQIVIKIINLDEKTMYFSCGLHPGFSYQGLKNLFHESPQFFFSSLDVESVLFDPCYVEKIVDTQIEQNMELEQVSQELSKSKTICYQGLQSIELRSKTKTLKFMSQMPYMALWQANPLNPEFICIEPWDGLPDEKNANHQLEDKKYCHALEPGKSYTTEIEISYTEEV